MYYDARELRSLSILKKVKKNSSIRNISEKELLYSCVSIISYLLIYNDKITEEMSARAEQISNIASHAKSFDIANHGLTLELLHNALFTPLNEVGQEETRGLLNYLVAKLINILEGIDHRHCRIVSGFAGTIFNLGRYDVVDVVPNIADLTLGAGGQGIRYSFTMLDPVKNEQKKLIELKLHCNGIQARFSSSINELPKPREHLAYLIDGVSQDVKSNSSHNTINDMTSEEIYQRLFERFGTQGLYIMTRSAKGANSAEFKRTWPYYNQNIEAIVAFDSYHKDSIKRFFFIVINNERSYDQKTLYINISDNPAISSLDAIERSILAASIYILWKSGSDSRSNMSQKVASMLNSQFKKGYRDVNGLCKVVERPRSYDRYFFSVNRHVNFSKKTPITTDYNSDQLMEWCESREPVCLYLLGNNGAGKSLLLGRLASQLIDRKKSSTGITLSQSNRFPSPENEEYFRKYCLGQGARHQFIDAVPRLLSKISCNHKKLPVLLKCLDLLDFTQDLYLGTKAHSKKRPEVDVESLISIGRDAIENETTMREVHLDSLTLILVKNTDPDNYIFFSELSSGEKNILTLLILCIDSTRFGEVILLDEPEISLHVSWQQRLPQILDIIAQGLHASFITATHSPLLISNAPTKNTHCYTLDTGNLKYIEPEERRSVETALVSIFDTYTPFNKEIYERCARLVALTIEQKNNKPDVSSEQFDNSLEQLDLLMDLLNKSSVTNRDQRFESDLELVRKAQLAIMAVRDEGKHVRV
ncbi:AAA family ATPase [Pseudomonas lijiangensis]|uniref:AAA family ATPase n=1 Tax=Pseudomonas lijiangensis TaxID=2995658 RepID=UPI0034D5E383